MKIAIDFDGTLCKRTGIPTLEPWDKCGPVEGASQALWLLYERGIEFYILTAKAKTEFEKMRVWLNQWGFPQPEKLFITNCKQKGTTVYIDDRGIRFTNWNDIRKLFV